jgi:hypothetical protein
MSLNVATGKLNQVRSLFQADLLRLFLSRVYFPAIAQHAANHPECADTYGAGAVNKRGTVCGIVGDLQELSCLFIFRLAEDERNVEVTQPTLWRALLLPLDAPSKCFFTDYSRSRCISPRCR